MIRIAVAVCLMLSLASPATAGPWLREKGKSFVSQSFTLNKSLESASSSYIEYGWSDRTTIGADVGMFRDLSKGQSGFATFFMRRNFGNPDRRAKLAWELGLGAGWVGDTLIPHLKTGVSWGRGYQLGERGGWMVVDASVRWDLGQSLHVVKVDGTVGLNLNERFTGMVQLYLSHADGDSHATLAPSLIWTPKSGKYKIQIGAESPVDAFSDTAVKIGIWREF